jgi:DnaJ domain
VPCQRRPVSANEKQINRTLAKKYHADKNKNDPRAENKFIEITKAYDALMSPDKHAYADHDYTSNTTQQQRLQYRRQHQTQYNPFVDDDDEVFAMNTPYGRFFFKSSRFSNNNNNHQHLHFNHYHGHHTSQQTLLSTLIDIIPYAMYQYPYTFFSVIITSLPIAYQVTVEILSYIHSFIYTADDSMTSQTDSIPPWLSAKGIICVLCARDALSVSALCALRYKFRRDPIKLYRVRMTLDPSTT